MRALVGPRSVVRLVFALFFVVGAWLVAMATQHAQRFPGRYMYDNGGAAVTSCLATLGRVRNGTGSALTFTGTLAFSALVARGLFPNPWRSTSVRLSPL